MASCPIAITRGKGRRTRQDMCGGDGSDLGYEHIQWGAIYRAFRCRKCGNTFVAYPRAITEADKKTIAYAIADT